MKYQYTVNGDELRFKYCPICNKEKDNPDFAINIKQGVYFCFANNKGGRVEELAKYGFDIENIPELRGFYKGNNKGLSSGNSENINDFGGENTLSNDETNNFNDNSSNKARYRNSCASDNNFDSREIKKDIDLSPVFLQRKNDYLGEDWIKYLNSRGISDKHLKKFARLGKNNSMMIPLTDGKKVVGIKYRTLDKKIFSEKSSLTDYLMNWQLVKDFSYLIIVEGEIDLLSSVEVGFENVVSLPFGAGNLKAIEHQKEWLARFDKIIIATDNDTQGKKSKDEIIKILSSVKGKLYEVDMGDYKDFNEVLTSELKDSQSNITNQYNKALENQTTDNKSDNTNQTCLDNRTLENNYNDGKLNKTNTNQLNNTDHNNNDFKNNSKDYQATKINQELLNIGKERLIKIIKNPKKIEKNLSPFSIGEDGYYYNLTNKITDFICEINKFSDNYISGTVITNGRKRDFFAKKTDLLTRNGILENLGYFTGSLSIIPSFWSWILEINQDKYIQEIEHYGIIDDKYYDPSSPIICGKNDLKIKLLNEIEDFSLEEKEWLNKNIIYLRKDFRQSLLGICWAIGRFHIDSTYPILEVSGTTSIGKTEFIEFISRIMFGTKENIKSLTTLSNHQIRSFSSCSNITPWAIDEVKITSRYQKDRAMDLYSTIRSVYDNKTINQGNITSKLTEFKLCTPLIISGETEILDVSIKNRMISVGLNNKNKSDDEVFLKLKNTDYLEKLGRAVLNDRLLNGKNIVPLKEAKSLLKEVKDERQIYNGMCLLTGLRAFEKIFPLEDNIRSEFIKFLNRNLSNTFNVKENFMELLELVRDSGKEIESFYQIKGDRHFVRFSMLYKAIKDEWEHTNSTLELLDMRTLKKQLIEEGVIINDKVSVRFPKNEFVLESISVKACEIIKNQIFIKDFFAED